MLAPPCIGSSRAAALETMATPNTTDPTLTSNDPATDNSESDARNSEDQKTECSTLEDVKSGDVKPQDDDDQAQHTATPPTMPSPPIAVASAHWETTLENLLRFPGMESDKKLKLFRPGNPIAQIAFALGVTNSTYNNKRFTILTVYFSYLSNTIFLA